MHRSTLIYDRKIPFAAPRNVNVVCYNYNKVGHKSHECRKKKFQLYGNPYSSSFNKNVNYNNYGQHVRVDRTYERQRYAWNKMKDAPRLSRNQFVPLASHNGMAWRRKSNQTLRSPSNHPFGMNIMYYYNNNLGNTTRYFRARVVKKGKMMNATPKVVNESRKGVKQVWKRKQVNAFMEKHDAFHAHVIYPQS